MGSNRYLDDNAKRIAATIIDNFGRRIAEKILDSFEREAVSPPGWRGTVEHMKEHKEITNPWALCLDGNTKVPLLDGTERTLRELADICSADPDATFWVYSFDLGKDRVCAKRARHARRTGVRRDIYEVCLDNGEQVVVTGNHPWLLLDGTYVKTESLKSGMRCMPFYRRMSQEPADRLTGYEMVLQPRRMRKCGCGCGEYAKPDKEFIRQHHRRLGSRGTYDRAKGIVDPGHLSFDDGYWQYTHKFAAGRLPPSCRNDKGQFVWGPTVHHKNFCKTDNRPDNLEFMPAAQHAKLHGKLTAKWLDAGIKALKEWRSKNPKLYRESLIRAGKNAKKGHAGLRRYNTSEKCRRRASRYSSSGEQTKDWIKNICARILGSGRVVNSESWDEHKLAKNAPGFKTAIRYFGDVDNLILETERKHKLGVNHKIVSVRMMQAPVPVYDLTVDDTHNFAIGAGVFVHNSWWMHKQKKPGGKKKKFKPHYTEEGEKKKKYITKDEKKTKKKKTEDKETKEERRKAASRRF